MRTPSAVLLAAALGLLPAALTHCRPNAPPPTQATSTTAPAGSSAAPVAELTPGEVDQMLRARWQKEGITPAPRVDDAGYYRRVSLALRGVIPSAEEVESFLASPAEDRRAKAVEAMLASPRYAEHWTNHWERVLLGNQLREALVDRASFRGWLRQHFEKNTPWDELVRGLLTASGQNRPDGDDASAVNGAVNWLLKYKDTPADLAGATSRVFLGVQIQCAQCHDHKTEKWKIDDFRRFTACFVQTKGELVERDGNRRRVDVYDTERPVRGGPRRMGFAEYAEITPGALDGSDFSGSPSRRKALASWMTAPENPWFARAIVNRLWGHFLGPGIVHPIDDFRDTNPPVMPELLDRLAADLVQHKYDLKRTMRLIVSTEAYQLAAGPREAQGKLWSRYHLRPLGSDELLDSLIAATQIDRLLARNGEDELERIKQMTRGQFHRLFDVDEEDNDEDFDGTIPQSLLLLNGRLTSAGSTAVPGAALGEILASEGDDASKIRALYLRTLGRPPSAAEVERWRAFLDAPREVVQSESQAPPEAKGKGKGKKNLARDPLTALDKNRALAKKPGPRAARRQAYEDLFWALLNSSEFFFNH
ncbi:MAG: DUF1549 and DUF1553 domain-containing protein [Polyangiaceae bacterium]|nr:DUF1549 and DUF1553 domain-containing protein [Polyangiaceae bacterium]